MAVTSKPRRPQHRIYTHALGMTKRQIQKYVVFSVLGVWLFVWMVYFYFGDNCHGSWHTKLLCEEYNQGNIGGDLCRELCVTKTLYLSSCERDHQGFLIFPVNATSVIKTRDHFPSAGAGGGGGGATPVSSLSHVYKQPEGGTSMEEFRAMVESHLTSRLGTGDRPDLVQHLLNVADVNSDDKISLAEAKTLYALLKHNEFLLLQILRQNYHVPRLPRFCGEVYQLTQLPPTRAIYTPTQWTFWGFPDWVSRGKIAVGVLDFALDVYQHQSDGAFYLCNLNESNIGYSVKHDAVLWDMTAALPRQTLEVYVRDTKCTTDSQCRFTDHCTTVCDADSRTCSGELVRPNLALICRILKPYLLPGIPKHIKPDFLNLMFRCVDLKTTAADFEVQHSLILNDLKSLLWRQISAEV